MKLWLAYTQDLYEVFDPTRHCQERFDEFTFSMSVSLGQAATIEIERVQTGWSLIQARSVLISESLTDDPADAYVRARGRIVGLPTDLLGSTQSISVVCGPKDLQEKLLAFCKANLASGPETDFLFADASPGDVESYLLGRGGNLQVDPATHNIRFVDDIVADVTHDMAAVAFYDGGRPADGPGLYDPPAEVYKAQLSVAWTQTAEGDTDIRGRFPGGIETLDGAFAGRFATSVATEGAEGWTVGAVRVRTTVTETLPVSVGSFYTTAQVREQVLMAYDPKDGETQNFPQNFVAQRPPYEDHGGGDLIEIRPLFRNYRHSIQQFQMSYVYSQPRSERAYIALEMPVQPFVLVRDEDPEPIQMVLGDIFADSSIEEWETDRDYAEGERVRHGEGYYRAVAPHHSTFFDEDTGVRVEEPFYFDGQIVPGVSRFTTTYWMRVYPDDIPTPADMLSFLETPRGQACIQHALLRLRKEARRRLLARHMTAGFDWTDAAHVDLADGMSLVVSYDGGTTGRRVSGKIVTMEYAWDGSSAVIDIEMAIPFGTGLAEAPPVGDGWADDYADDYAGQTVGAIAEIDFDVVADPPKGYVDPRRLFSPNYSCISATVKNQTATQLASIGEVVADKADPTEVSVRVPTYATIRMRSLAPQELPERELDVVATMLTSPVGLNLAEGPVAE